MAQVIVVTSGKGGVGKTTSSAAIATGLAQTGKKVAASEPPPPGLVIEEITGVDDPNSPFIQEGTVKTSGGHAWSLQVTWSDERQRWLVSNVEYLP